jgi:uncharacterized protein (DUF1778 family)
MPKIQKKKLREQFTVRIYNQDESDILKKAYNRFHSGFDTISDFIRQCVIIGAEKLLTDNTVDQRINLDEIKYTLYSIDEKLKTLSSKIDFNAKDQKIETYLIEDLLNFIAKVAYLSDCNKLVNDANIENGLFSLINERITAIKKVLDEE